MPVFAVLYIEEQYIQFQKPHKKCFEREIMRTKALEFIKQLIQGRNNIVAVDDWKRTKKIGIFP